MSTAVDSSAHITSERNCSFVRFSEKRITLELLESARDGLDEAMRESGPRVIVQVGPGSAVSLAAMTYLAELSDGLRTRGGMLVVVGLDRQAKRALRTVAPKARVQTAGSMRAAERAMKSLGLSVGRRAA